MKVLNLLMGIAAAVMLILGGSACAKKETNPELLTKALHAAKSAGWESALKYTRKAVYQNEKDVDALVLHAIALENTDAFNDALDTASKAVDLDPRNFMAQYTLGRLQYLRKKYDLAIKPLTNAVHLHPKDQDALLLLAQASAGINPQQALYYYKLLLSKRYLGANPRYINNSAVWNEIAITYLSMKNQDQRQEQTNRKLAEAFLLKAEGKAPENPTVALNLAILYDSFLPGQKSKAILYYRQYLRLTGNMTDQTALRSDVAKRLQVLSN